MGTDSKNGGRISPDRRCGYGFSVFGALSGRLGLLLPAHGRFLVMFLLAQIAHDIVFLTLTLETLQRAVERFVLADFDYRHRLHRLCSTEPLLARLLYKKRKKKSTVLTRFSVFFRRPAHPNPDKAEKVYVKRN